MKRYTRLRRRKAYTDANLPLNLPPLLRRIYLQRGVKEPSELDLGIKNLLPLHTLQGIDTAVILLHQMLEEKRRIMVIGDFDVDGAVSTALTVLILRRMGGNVDYFIPSRFKTGYGLNPEVVEQARSQGAQMILTVDNGISSHAGVDICRQYNIPVVITDHHLPGPTLPSAEAIVNPHINNNLLSCALAGVGVAFYLMIALRIYLRHQNWFTGNLLEPNMIEFIDLVALGTVADLVPLDKNNRILVWQGLNRIRAKKCRVGICALLKFANCAIHHLTVRDLGFVIGPRLNSAGRLENMSIVVALLLTDSIADADIIANKLNLLNRTRKKIEKGMQKEALALCNDINHDYSKLPLGLVFYHHKWHEGVIGILASWLKDRFHRPVIAFAPTGDGMILKGSGRSIIGLHLCKTLEQLYISHPGLIIKYGGHAMAVGLSIEASKYKDFCHNFTILIDKVLNGKSLEGIIWSDGELNIREISLHTAKMIREAGPWGQGFPEPIFDGHFNLLQQSIVYKYHLKIMIKPVGGGPLLNGIVFNIDPTMWPDKKVHKVEIAYRMDINYYQGKGDIQLIVDYMRPL